MRARANANQVKAWILASGEKALSIKDADERVETLTFAVARLGERGHRADARRLAARLHRELAAHPDSGFLDAIAEAYVAAGRRADARARYAAAIAEVAASRKLKAAERADRLERLRAAAIDHGFADLLDDLTPQEKSKVAYRDAVARAEAALEKRDRKSALAAAREAERVGRSGDPVHLVDLYAGTGDKAAALRMLRKVDREERALAYVGPALAKLGLKRHVARLASAEVRDELARARRMTLPNYHHPTMAIVSVVHFLIDHGLRDLARHHIVATMKAARRWRLPGGWTEAAVYAEIATAIARLDGPAAARPVLAHAAEAASSDDTAHDTAGLTAVIDAFNAAGLHEQALSVAAKLRPAEYRRRYTARTLAVAGRRKELDAVFAAIASATEASETAWWIAAALERHAALARRG